MNDGREGEQRSAEWYTGVVVKGTARCMTARRKDEKQAGRKREGKQHEKKK